MQFIVPIRALVTAKDASVVQHYFGFFFFMKVLWLFFHMTSVKCDRDYFTLMTIKWFMHGYEQCTGEKPLCDLNEISKF